jgi:DNA-binding MarR family transcriptional regulator
LNWQDNRDILQWLLGQRCCRNILARTGFVADRAHLDLGNYLPYLINRVGFALVESFTADALTPNGLSIAMWRVLAALSSRGEQRQIDLVDMTSIDASTMSRLVTRLVRDGLVTRSRSAKSSREVVVELGPRGRALVQRLIPIAKKLEQTASAGLAAKDLAVAKRALGRMYDNLVSGR